MKLYRKIVVIGLFFFLPLWIHAGIRFDDYFLDKTMRIDYYHMADKTTEFFSLDLVYEQGIWAGNSDSLIDTFDNGNYYIKIYDHDSNTLIYSKGFNSYCGEYTTTDMAAQGIKRTYHESALIPYPKKKITFTLEKRDRKNNLNTVFSQTIDPASVDINKESLIEGVTVVEALKNGDPHRKVDLAFIAEGYAKNEEEKFKQDLKRMTDLFFSMEPYKSRKKDFNVYGVYKASQDSGPDEPRQGIYKNTVVDASFNALGLSRYMLTEGNRDLRDIAAHAPYDSVIIMVNSPRYGGGGIYNSFCLFTADNEWHKYLLLHEFGHSFAGLADEYYASTVAYNEFYPKGTEPAEPNITALLDKDNLKWKHLVKKGTPLPTPWDKEEFDKMPREQRDAHLASDKFKGLVGAFEGAGYASEGLYRPMVNCIMFSKGDIPYCLVCRDAVARMIDYYSK